MQKVLVSEIGSEMTVVNAFSDLDTENPRLLGQGVSPTTLLDGDVEIGIRLAVTDLEKDIGPVGSLGKIPFYATSSASTWRNVQEGNGQNTLNALEIQDSLQIVTGRILPTPRAIMKAVQLIYEEVGDVLVLDVGSESTDVYSVTLMSEPLAQRTVGEDLGIFINALALVKLIGENKIKEHHGQDWEKLLKSRPETPEEIALSAELTAAAVTIVLQRHSGRSYNDNEAGGKVTSVAGRDLTKIRWIVGTGVALTQLPNGLEIMRGSIQGMKDDLFPQGSIAMLLDKDCIMASLGVLTTPFRQGAWQLLRESLGVEN
ncbi:glutamate mutase L [Desulfosporosinus sp. Sb-LF]|uniref:glutamate mutase L n=1 Tax=Desulfosporosinus sp. Sb-LF TaxID=2560027 RepID=UPI00107F31F3|nr:glutamate mutase L [Desulfosporosinus sp. Sb-LF]TGE31677.1 hypothetical protein E4K68_15800 [Desulfosporosinus sp. Sb-LF]